MAGPPIVINIFSFRMNICQFSLVHLNFTKSRILTIIKSKDTELVMILSLYKYLAKLAYGGPCAHASLRACLEDLSYYANKLVQEDIVFS